MAEDRQIDAISIGIGANIAGLKASLAEAQREVSGFQFRPPGAAEIPFTVKINAGIAENQLKRLVVDRTVNINAVLIPTKASIVELRKVIKEQMSTSGGGIQVPFTADLKSAKAIKESIQAAMNAAGPVTVQVAWAWAQGGPPTEGGGGMTPPSAPGGQPRRRGPKPAGPSGGNATVTPTPPPQEPAAPSPRIVTRPQRPVKAKAGQMGGFAPYQGTAAGTGPVPRGGGGNIYGNTEFQPGVGAARAQGVGPSFDQRLKRAVARTMKTGDPSDIFSVLGPFGESLSMTPKGFAFPQGSALAGYNLQGLGGEQVNLAKLINEAMSHAQAGRRPDQGPLREFEDFVPRDARFNPETLMTAARVGDLNYDFVQRAKGRAAGTGGVYSDIDVHIAGQRRQLVNRIRQQLHAEDPKAFKAAFDTRRGSVDRLKDAGLMQLANLTASSAGLKTIAPATPDFLEDLAAAEKHNKAMRTAAEKREQTRKRVSGKDREQSTVVNPETGKKKTLYARGLPYARQMGHTSVKSVLDILNNTDIEEEASQAMRGFALGGKIPGVHTAVDEARWRKLNHLIPRVRERGDRRYQTIHELKRQGFGPDAPERDTPHRLHSQAEALIDRVGRASQEAWTGQPYDAEVAARQRELNSRYALGGKMPWGKSGAYIVGEQGDEVFVPETAGWIIPHRLKDQLPKRASGGVTGNPDDPHEIEKRQRAEAVRAFREERKAEGIKETKAETRVAFHAQEAAAAKPGVSQPLARDLQGGYLPGDPAQAAARRFASAFIKEMGPAIRILSAKAGERVTAKSLLEGANTSDDMRRALNAMMTAAGHGGGGGFSDGGGEEDPFGEFKFKQTPAQLAEARIKGVMGTLEAAQSAALVRSGIAENVAQLPQRAPGVSGGQFVATTLGGRGNVLETKRLAEFALSTSSKFRSWETKAIELQATAMQKLSAAQEAGEKELGPYTVEVEEQTAAIEKYHKAAEDAGAIAEGFAKKTGTSAQKMSVFATNISGVIGATLLYGTAFGAIQTVISGITPALASAIDMQTGFLSTATRVTTALGAQTVAQHGNAEAVLYTASATAGLNKEAADYIQTQLQATAQTKAGATAQQAASDLFRAAAGARAGAAPEGLFGGYGGLFGSSLLASQIGGGKGFSETTQGDLSGLSSQAIKNPLFENFEQGLSYLSNPALRDSIDSLASNQGMENPTDANPVVQSFMQMFGGPALMPALGGIGDQFFRGGHPPPDPVAAEEYRTAQAQDPNSDVSRYIKNLNDNIRRVGGTAEYRYTTNPEERKAGVAAAAAAVDMAGVAAAAQGFVVSLGRAVASTEEYTTAVQQAAKGASLPNEAVVRAAMNLQRAISQGVITAQRERQLDFSLPAQNALSFYGNQPLTPGTGIVPPTGAAGYGGFGATDPYTDQSFGRFRDRAQSAFDDISSYAASGLTKLYDAGVPPDLIQKYKSLGDSIRDIRTDLANKQAVQSAVQYNHQLFITNRALKDAAALVSGRATDESHNLGFLQRQMYTLERQSTSLSLAKSQREINFSVAKAGFQAPGLTSEERSANIAEAKFEADYAQKQLNISKKEFTVGGLMFEEGALRQLNDVKFALADLKASHIIEIDARGAQQTIEYLNAQLGIAGAQIGVDLQANEAAFAASVSEAATIAASATDAAFKTILAGNMEMWNTWIKSLSGTVSQGANTTGGPDERNNRLGSVWAPAAGADRQHAMGVLGSANSATGMIVGEAGNETVAVLRNPRPGYTPSGGGSGGYVFNITINGNASEGTARDLADEIVRRVEGRINQRAGMIMRVQ